MNQKILLIGCGNMGGAMLNAWLAKWDAANFCVVAPSETTRAPLAEKRVITAANSDQIPEDFAPTLIMIAIKPQMMATILPEYKKFADNGAAFLSIAAGKTISFMEDILGKDTAIIRTMPNTPAAIGKGVTAAIANKTTSPEIQALCDELLKENGTTIWLENENQIDPLSAISGSGPAFLFHFVESLEAAALNLGLPFEMAKVLAKETVVGSAELLNQSSETPSQLRINVTSPKGSTEAGLKHLMDDKDGLIELMKKTTKASTARAKELGKI
ncbi:MAG: pyrroline-5-carboxylate reductase [Alphaproteobacteria bacterium]|nr:pyrroline-5-carboxylate reductase [Alphaproteobacteria bacterium]